MSTKKDLDPIELGAASQSVQDANQKVLQDLLAWKIGQEKAEHDALLAKQRDDRERYAKERERERLIREAFKNSCPHTKQNGTTALGGQRLSNGNILLICQHCQKTWEGEQVDELPSRLAPDASFIGSAASF